MRVQIDHPQHLFSFLLSTSPDVHRREEVAGRAARLHSNRTLCVTVRKGGHVPTLTVEDALHKAV